MGDLSVHPEPLMHWMLIILVSLIFVELMKIIQVNAAGAAAMII